MSKDFGWLFESDTKPETPADLHRIALENNCKPKEAAVVGEIALRYGMVDNPFLDMDEGYEDGEYSCVIDLRIPPDEERMLDVYNRSNGVYA